DLGENDVVLIAPGQKAQLEVDAFKDRKFHGLVTEIANSSKDSAVLNTSSSSQEATKFEVRIGVQEKEEFRPGMSVTAEIETRYRTNVLTVPIASVTTRLPKEKGKDKKGDSKMAALDDPPATGSSAGKTNAQASSTGKTSTTNTSSALAEGT